MSISNLIDFQQSLQNVVAITNNPGRFFLARRTDFFQTKYNSTPTTWPASKKDESLQYSVSLSMKDVLHCSLTLK